MASAARFQVQDTYYRAAYWYSMSAVVATREGVLL